MKIQQLLKFAVCFRHGRWRFPDAGPAFWADDLTKCEN